MKFRLLYLLLFFLALASSDPDTENLSKSLKKRDLDPLNRLLPLPGNGNNVAAGARSLLSRSTEHDRALVASLDGTIYLVESASGKIHWSFSSGSSLSSSYQALPDNDNNDGDTECTSGHYLSGDYFVDCGDDWELYIYSKCFGSRKLPITIEEYVSKTPYMSEDGGFTLGSRTTTVFLVDVKTGQIIHKYRLPATQSTLGLKSDEENAVIAKKIREGWVKSGSVDLKARDRLSIMRTDYALQSFAPNSDEVLWNMTVSEISATFLCQGPGSAFTVLPLDPSVNGEDDIEMPYPCQTEAVVFRTRDRNLLRPNLAPSFDNTLESGHQGEVLPLPPPKIQDNHVVSLPRTNQVMPFTKIDEFPKDKVTSSGEVILRSSVALFLFLLGGHYLLMWSKHFNFKKLSSNPSENQSTVTKRRKARKAGNNKNGVSSENEETQTKGLSLSNQTEINKDGSGRFVGRLFVSNIEIAKGSDGTIVFEGTYDGLQVAVKRLVRSHHDVAIKEIENLIASHKHPNIVGWYGIEEDVDFVYLKLERCDCSLNDLIQRKLENTTSGYVSKSNVQLDAVSKHVELWRENGRPSPHLLKLMRDVVSGLVYLHKLGIIHRDLKPQNVLINIKETLCAKLSDMGISKRLSKDMTSLGHHATGCGSSGWQAPEQLSCGRQTRAVDLFSLGCVLFFCITKGKHPFGEPVERDYNIINNRFDLFIVEHIPEAVHLFSCLLDPNPELRPKAIEVLQHPLFWDPESRLSFLRDVSDRIEAEDREGESDFVTALENVSPITLDGKWDEKLEAKFITNIGHYRRYKYDSIRDLLRVIRNKSNHYGDLPKEIQELLGPVPEGFDDYFTSRYPKLLIEVYKVVHRYRREERCFRKYFGRDG